MMMKKLYAALSALSILIVAQSCIEDGFTTSASSQPSFSSDTLDMGTYFTGQLTPTARFVVHNRHDKSLNISSVVLREGDGGAFRVNVDGLAGSQFSNVEIRPNDSIYVFVKATLPVNSSPALTEVKGHLDFVTNGVTSTVVLRAAGRDVDRRRAVEITADERWGAQYPYQIFDSLIVREGATLRLDPGVRLHFHDGAYMRVYGSLITEGTPEAQVEMTGDRTDNVVGDISFDLMASQWQGLRFAPQSRGNRLSHTVVRNTAEGVVADSLSAVEMVNCRLRNSAGMALTTRHALVRLIGCEIADASYGAVLMHGGEVTANHCTFANYYLFTAPRGAIAQFGHYDADTDDGSGMPYLKADISNSIVYGLGADLSEGDFTGTDVYIRSCVLKSSGSDDDNFIGCLWDTDPSFATVREDYHFDYRLNDGSPALGHADPTLTLPEAAVDLYGIPRLPAPRPGAYQSAPDDKSDKGSKNF